MPLAFTYAVFAISALISHLVIDLCCVPGHFQSDTECENLINMQMMGNSFRYSLDKHY